MAINKFVMAALKALSYPDIDIKRNYKWGRQVTNVTHYHYLKPFYKTWDHKVPCGDHDVPVRIFSPPGEGHHSLLLFSTAVVGYWGISILMTRCVPIWPA